MLLAIAWSIQVIVPSATTSFKMTEYLINKVSSDLTFPPSPYRTSVVTEFGWYLYQRRKAVFPDSISRFIFQIRFPDLLSQLRSL